MSPPQVLSMWSSSVSYDGEIIIKCPGGPEGDSIRDKEDDVQIRDEAEGRAAKIQGMHMLSSI